MAARLALQNLEVKVAVTYADDVYSSADAGTVIATDPDRGETIHEGDTVVLTCSKGPQPVEMITFLNMSREDAQANLDKLGLLGRLYRGGERHGPCRLYCGSERPHWDVGSARLLCDADGEHRAVGGSAGGRMAGKSRTAEGRIWTPPRRCGGTG